MSQSATHTPAITGEPTTTPPPAGKGPFIAAAGGFLLLAVVGVAFLIPKLHHENKLEDNAREVSGPPIVALAAVAAGAPSSKLELPGTVQPFAQTPVYARTSGYISKRFVDIGDHVKAGQLLAIIEDPQTEQSLRQARATLLQLKAQLLQAQANANLSTLNNTRGQQLHQEGVISQEAADNYYAQSGANDATVAAAKANIGAGEANVKSLEEQASFSRVTAPFTGVILSRSIDNGSLITSGSANSVTQLFTIGQSGVVRVFINVPQSNAPDALNSSTAQVTFRELPGRVYSGALTRSSTSIDPASRTLLAEIDLQNTDSKILPGMFATVSFAVKNSRPPVLLPGNALVVRTAGPQAYTVDANNVAHLHNVVLGRDYGTSVEILDGLKAGDRVILSPSDAVQDGGKVEPENNKK
jgi:RND family efflux transporter MFP subunit